MVLERCFGLMEVTIKANGVRAIKREKELYLLLKKACVKDCLKTMS